MRLSLKWLSDYVKLELPPQELAFRLTMAGVEVGGIEAVGGQWDSVKIGQVSRIDPHPNADRLVLATVDLGDRSQTVVTGAPNLAVGQKVPFAESGTRIFDGHTGQPTVLKPATIRGVRSEGMVLSERELGISDEHEGILVLPDDAPVGAPLQAYLGDTVLDLELTPNRPDEMSVIGIAREVSAITGQPVREPSVSYSEGGESIGSVARVEIWDVDLCPRYAATLIRNIKVGPSPAWMQRRLEASGMRPINNVVDVTNYVMLEFGQPLHAFDFNRLDERRIIVRRPQPAEELRTLDGQLRQLEPDMLMIADASHVVAIAGVMGGHDSEVTDDTTDVLIESANFDNISIRRTSSKLRLRTEASARFEKGLPIELPIRGLRRATQLMAELTGGTAAPGMIDAYPEPRTTEPVTLPVSEFTRLLGVVIPVEDITRILRSLGLAVDVEGTGEGARLTVLPPWWRTDIRVNADVVEEVARIVGYDVLPTSLSLGDLPAFSEDEGSVLGERIRDILVAAGLQEVITYSLVSRDLLEKPLLDAEPVEPIQLANPMSSEFEHVRTSARGSLLSTLAQNLKHQDGPVALFEVGRVYLPRPDDLPDERRVLTAAMAGPRTERRWGMDGAPLGFFDAKGIAETLLDRLGASDWTLQPSSDPTLHPGKTASIRAGGREIGVVGEVHPIVAERFEIRPAAMLLEIDLQLLSQAIQAKVRYRPISRFPAVQRDLAIVVDHATPAETVRRVLLDSPLITRVELFDVYAGERLPVGKKSLAFALEFQAPDRTLTDHEVDRIIERIRGRLNLIDATLRT